MEQYCVICYVRCSTQPSKSQVSCCRMRLRAATKHGQNCSNHKTKQHVRKRDMEMENEIFNKSQAMLILIGTFFFDLYVFFTFFEASSRTASIPVLGMEGIRKLRKPIRFNRLFPCREACQYKKQHFHHQKMVNLRKSDGI